MATYFKVRFDNEVDGPFLGASEDFEELTWPGGGRGQIIDVFNETVTTGKLHVALIAGPLPSDNDVLSQNQAIPCSADADGDATTLLYPAYFRDDVSITDNAGDKDIAWTGLPVQGGGPTAGQIPTHSQYFDGQTGEFTEGEVITFGGGATAVVVDVQDQVGNEGQLYLRFTSDLDAGLPVDGETMTGDATGAAVVQGETHERSYTPLNLHRLLQDLNDDPQFVGDDNLSMIDATASAKDTDQIIRLIGGANITDEVASHMYGGSIAQTAGTQGDTKYSGLDVGVTSPNADTQPIIIQFDESTGLDAIITDYWANAWNPDSIAGNVRILVKTRAYGVDIDGRRVKGKLLEYGDNYFEGGTTLGDATTSLALFSSGDGNNNTAVGTVAGAPYNSVVFTEGFQTLNYNNGNGATPFSLEVDYGTASSPQAYERTKYVQRRGTAETLFGRNAQLVTGVNRNFGYDGQAGSFTENSIIAWGNEIPFTGQTVNFTKGEVLTFSGGGRGRLYAQDDNTGTGDLIVGDFEGPFPLATETITGESSGGNGTVDTGPVQNASFGIGLLIADDTTGDNLYYQQLAGLDPADNQRIWQDGTANTALVNGVVATRTINNQFVGLYTGTNFQTNFGIGIQPADAVLGDLNLNLLGVQQGVPNNQTGEITGVVVGDRATVYPWDGSTLDANGDAVPDFDQMTLDVALTGVAETSVDVNAIPDNTPASGQLRISLNSGVRRLVSYTSFTGSVFTIPATDFSGDNASIGNGTMIAYIDETATATTVSYTAIKGAGNTQVTATVRRGDNQPIVPFKANPIFGNNGFSVGAIRNSDA